MRQEKLGPRDEWGTKLVTVYCRSKFAWSSHGSFQSSICFSFVTHYWDVPISSCQMTKEWHRVRWAVSVHNCYILNCFAQINVEHKGATYRLRAAKFGLRSNVKNLFRNWHAVANAMQQLNYILVDKNILSYRSISCTYDDAGQCCTKGNEEGPQSRVTSRARLRF